MTRSSPEGTLRTFATLRVSGDRLDPSEITRLLRIKPTLAYAKDQDYVAGRESGTRKGRTGVWLVSTDRGIESDRLEDHIEVLLYMLFPSLFAFRTLRLHSRPVQRFPTIFGLIEHETKIRYLRHVMKEKGLTASVSLFWHGKGNTRPPSVPRAITTLFRHVPIAVETDFANDADMEPASISA